MILVTAYTAADIPVLLNGPDNRQKLSLPVGIPTSI